MSALQPLQAALRALAAVAGTAALAASALGSAVPARADTAVAPKSGSITIQGAGWGHGKGMSQYGARGAASKGLSYKQILGFYYPGTDLKSLDDDKTIRVWITADNDNGLHFRPATGQVVSDSAGKKVTLPTGSKYTKWVIKRSGSKRVLSYRNTSGKYVKYSTKLSPTRVWYVSNSKTGIVKLAMPNGSTRSYRGKLGYRFSGSSGSRTVNYVSMAKYLRGVVSAEMPASWPAEALKAQAVAARTYAARLRASVASGATYDLCDTSACQVYKGTAAEYAATDKAISGTADKVVMYKGKPALTMFSSSNGGWSASGGSSYPYLKAQKDTYDPIFNPNRSWSVSLSSSKIQKAYPSVGTLMSVQITKRDGDGTYGGRVDAVRITGSKTSVTVSGGTFKSKFGLKERLFKIVTAAPSANLVTPNDSANYQRWQELGGKNASIGSPTGAEVSVAGGRKLAFAKADLWWSAATGSRLLTGAVRDAYTGAGGATSKLGFPKTDVISSDAGTHADFQLGRITCPKDGKCVFSFG